MAPRISIVIPCYNHGRFIREAIASVEKCPGELWELIIVNDGSTDAETLHILDSLKADGYRIIDQENKGPAAARNTAIAEAAGEYILPLDSDNQIRPAYLETGIGILDNFPETGVVYGDAEFCGEREGIWKGREFNLCEMALGNYIDTCAVYRKRIWVQLGGYDTRIPRHGVEDWEFWLGAAKNGWFFHYVPEVLFDYRVRNDSVFRTLVKDGCDEAIDYVTRKHSWLISEQFRSRYRELCTAELTMDWHRRAIRDRPLRSLGKLAVKALLGRDPFGSHRPTRE